MRKNKLPLTKTLAPKVNQPKPVELKYPSLSNTRACVNFLRKHKNLELIIEFFKNELDMIHQQYPAPLTFLNVGDKENAITKVFIDLLRLIDQFPAQEKFPLHQLFVDFFEK